MCSSPFLLLAQRSEWPSLVTLASFGKALSMSSAANDWGICLSNFQIRKSMPVLLLIKVILWPLFVNSLSFHLTLNQMGRGILFIGPSLSSK
jgi:hypothetical protein